MDEPLGPPLSPARAPAQHSTAFAVDERTAGRPGGRATLVRGHCARCNANQPVQRIAQ